LTGGHDRRHKTPVVRILLLAGPLLLAGCHRGPRYCLFDGTFIGAAPVPFVPLNPEGSADDRPSRFTWREFVWPTDPQFVHVRPEAGEWIFEGTTGGVPWSFRGAFLTDGGGTFVRIATTGTPPAVEIEGQGRKPAMLFYRLRPCREFLGSPSGVRTCTRWGAEVNARTRLTCE
jgi:hypothetical protein